ncbi:M48 family metallopeptidase [bacterium]|nr:M48 family metallopeptidase [bacterium]MBP3846391.1 M48 family metallopeptidase [bacterium]
MKKIITLLLIGVFSVNCAIARDYAALQIKEMKHAQKYNTTQKYFFNQDKILNNFNYYTSKPSQNTYIKDPKIFKLPEYQEVDEAKYQEKLKADDKIYNQYKKSMFTGTIFNYNAKANGEDYYKVYRIAERIIRANKLNYINWRIGIYKDAENINAYSFGPNYIAISTSLYDSFNNNDDALAIVIGHEIAHTVLGHSQRKNDILRTMLTLQNMYKAGDPNARALYTIKSQQLMTDGKNMEYAADVEGAKLAAKAGYSLDESADLLSFLNTDVTIPGYLSDHPVGHKRIENFYENRKYFIEDQWAEIGKYNILNSEVMPVKLSSDRKSLTIGRTHETQSKDNYYSTETMEDIYLRFAYKSYLCGEFKKAAKYFKQYFEINNSNAIAYLYASYNSEAIYKILNRSSALEDAKNYITTAYNIDKNNEFIKEQYDNIYKLSPNVKVKNKKDTKSKNKK